MFTMYSKLTDLLACLGGSGDTACPWGSRTSMVSKGCTWVEPLSCLGAPLLPRGGEFMLAGEPPALAIFVLLPLGWQGVFVV